MQELNKIRYIYCHLRQKLEKAMATHFGTVAWKIPWMEEPGRLQSMGSLGVGHDWTNSLSLFPFMHWRRKWQPTQVFLPGESQGRQSLVGCLLWGRTELDTTEVTWQQQQDSNQWNRMSQKFIAGDTEDEKWFCKLNDYQTYSLQNILVMKNRVIE